MRYSTHDLQEIFLNAIQFKSPQERRSYVERACDHDPQLIDEVVSLLDAHYEAEFLTELAPAPAKTKSMEEWADAPGTVIGQYKLREQLGEGGMGIVYLAEQMEPIRRKLALKIIKPGMDSKSVLARFEAERQALAMMSHPNIAGILDGGTTEQGRPYFVMELVRGIPINEYCDLHKLTIRERLKLFIRVCYAVQHAHMKGIIHRDLKPTNILIEQQGDEAVPKIIDFGIAKALHQPLTQQTVYTQFAQLIGTPEYMSPEQARLSEIDIDTRSDVYSLGVMLYELLTGLLPYETDPDSRIGFEQIRRIISEDEPRRPSQKLSTLENHLATTVSNSRKSDPHQLAISMRRELDWITLKALEKDRSRRYDSATALAQDIQRYLDHAPVQACPPSLRYRLQKYLYQNRTFVVASTMVIVSALASAGVSLWYASQATISAVAASEAQSRAEGHAQQAESLSKQSRRLMYASDIKLAGELWKQGDVRGSSDILERYTSVLDGEEDLRDFEWWFLHNLLTEKSLLLDSRDEQGCLARYSPEGRYLILGWTDGRVDVRDGQTHDFLFTLEGNGDFVNGCDFHPHENWLATIADDSMLRVWDLTTQQKLQEYQVCEGHGHRVFFSADGESLITSGEEGRVRFWETSTGDPLGEIGGLSNSAHSGVEERMDCSRSRKWIAIGDGDGAGAIYDFQTRKKLITLDGINRNESLRCLRFSPDEKLIAGAKKSADVYVWRTDTGAQIARFQGHLDDIQDLVFHPEGGELVTSDRAGVIRRWKFEESNEPSQPGTRGLLQTPDAFRGHRDRIWSIDFSTDGSTLVTGSRDNSFKLWKKHSHRNHQILPVKSPTQASFINGGDELLIVEKDQLKTWNRASGEIRSLTDTSSPLVQLTVDEQSHLTAAIDESGCIYLWDVNAGKLISKFNSQGDGHYCLSLSPDGQLLADAAYQSSFVSLWDLSKSGNPRLSQTFGELNSEEEEEAFDGAWLAPDNRSLVLHKLNELHIYDLKRGTIDRSCRHHLNRVCNVAFSSDGSLMASGSDDRTVCLWDFATGELIHSVSAHSSDILDLAFSPDGGTLVSGDEDGIVIFSHVSTGRVLFETKIGKGKILDLDFSPDGRHLAVVQPESLVLLNGTPNHSGFNE